MTTLIKTQFFGMKASFMPTTGHSKAYFKTKHFYKICQLYSKLCVYI